MRPLATNPAASKALLASLMATEALTVEHDPKATTASFNVETRVLTLPVWKDLPVDTLDMLIGHEVSHALNTPKGRETLERAVKSIDAKNYGVAKDYVNVVEDARIERLIKRDYPGLRRCFVNGYDDLLKRDLFGLAKGDRKVADLPLIDRINLQYKIGHRVNIPFTAEELPLVQRVATTTSWEDVVALSKELYDLAREQKKREQEEQKQAQNGGSTGQDSEDEDESESQQDGDGAGGDEDGDTENQDTGDEDGQSGDESDEDDADDGDAPEGEQGQGDVQATGDARGNKATDEDAESNQSATGNEAGGENGDPSDEDIVPDASETLKAAEDKLAKSVDANAQAYYYADIPEPTDRMVVSQKATLEAFRKYYSSSVASPGQTGSRICYEAWKKSNSDAVQILATEFDRRKAADEHRRSTVAETGVIDVNRLHAYRITDDIFLRNAVVKDGKNHGLVLLLDMSGSIQSVYFDLVTQLVTLAHFCRRVNIPFRFYGFTDRACTNGSSPDGVVQRPGYGDFDHFKASNFGGEKIRTRLVTLLSDGMKNLEFMEQCGYLLWAAYGITRVSYHGSDACPTRTALKANNLSAVSSSAPHWFHLDQTPLNAALLAAATLVPEFKRSKRLQVANLIVLTDGEAGDSMVYPQFQTKAWVTRHGNNPSGGSGTSRVVWRDPLTRKQYDMTRKSAYSGNDVYYNDTCAQGSTRTLLQILKDRGVSTTCIHVTPNRATAKKVIGNTLRVQGVTYDEATAEKLGAAIKSDDWFHVLSENGKGYADYIVFPVPSITAETELVAVDSNDKAGLRSLRSQFMKSMSARRANRPLLVRVAEIVSK